jgi:flagellar export protein FliJ
MPSSGDQARRQSRGISAAAHGGASSGLCGSRDPAANVRALRERKEEIAKHELAQAMGRLSDSEQRLRDVEDRLAAAHEGQRGAGAQGAMSAADLVANQAFVERVEQQRRHGVRELRRSAAEVADRGAALRSAARDHQMLERLKERHHAAHRSELARREGEMLDEIALDRFRRSVA